MILTPRGGLGRFDYYSPGSSIPSRAIYRIDGQKLWAAQGESGAARPTQFYPYMTWVCERANKSGLTPNSERQ